MQARFDWERVLRELNVDYRSKGANVGSGEINIKCPWCGTTDPSYHLGINVHKNAWRCWRNKAHAGRSVSYLLNKLVGPARASATLRKHGLTHNTALAPSPTGDNERIVRPVEFSLPRGISPIDLAFDTIVPRYLAARGFNPENVGQVVSRFHLHIGRFGEYAGRLIIPYLVGGQIAHFTARAMSAAGLRFKAGKTDLATLDPQELVFNSDEIEAPGGVVLVEGPLDAIKFTTYGPLPAVALSTNSMSKAQLAVLRRARRVIVFVDNDHVKTNSAGDITVAALNLYMELMRAGVRVVLQPMPRGVKDPAEIYYADYPRLVTIDSLLEKMH